MIGNKLKRGAYLFFLFVAGVISMFRTTKILATDLINLRVTVLASAFLPSTLSFCISLINVVNKVSSICKIHRVHTLHYMLQVHTC